MSNSNNRVIAHAVRAFFVFFFVLFANAAHAQNTISTYAGGPPPNGVSPTAAPIEGPQAVVRDPAGNLYVITDSGPIYKITPGTVAVGVLTIDAGNNTAGFSPNGTASASTLTFEPYGAALDANDNLYYSDANNCLVRELVGGVVKTIAGTGACKYTGDGGPATSATLNDPQGIAFDGLGNLYIADAGNNVIRRIDANGTITTYAGNGTQGFSGDNGAATSAELGFPQAIASDTSGNIFIADTGNNRIRLVNVTSKIITTIAGTGEDNYSGDGGPATSATLGGPDGLAVDTAGNVYIADTTNAVIRELTASPAAGYLISTIVGNNTFGFSGDGGPALNAELTNPAGIFVDSTTGNLYIADYWANRIRLYSPANNKQISTVVGSGQVGDGAAATSASMYFPRTPGLDAAGNLYIVDAENNRIRKVSAADQSISTVVGTGIPCAHSTFVCGDGGPATSAQLFMPRTVTIEANGTLLVADDGDGKIRQVDTSGTITTIVGSGVLCGNGPNQAPLPCGDGGPALSANLNDGRGAIHDAAGNLYFVDAQDNRVREVDTTGTITTIAGGGGAANTAPIGCANGTYTGDGGPAIDSTLDCPLGLDMDSAGNLFVADTFNNVIRKIDTGTPRIITTIIGTGVAGYTGDGGPAISATLNSPDRVSVNGAGNFFISDSNNQVIRRVDGKTKNIATFAGNGNFAFAGDGGPALSASFATPVGVVVGPQGNLYVGDVFNNRIRKVLLNAGVSFSVSPLAFGNQPVNANSMLPVTITNSGDAPLTFSGISATAGAFEILANPCPGTLAVGAQCILQIGFTPTQFIAYTGTLTLTDNAPTPGSMQTVNLTGTGAASLTITATGTGTVTSSPAGINCPTACTATFAGNSQVTLTATPGAGETFTGFSANCAPATATTCTITMSANETVTAAFTAVTSKTLTVTKAGTGTGTVTSAPAGINCGATCSASFATGTQITLTAAPATGSTFTGWGAPCSGTGTCVVTLTAATTVTATFAPTITNFTLTVTKAGAGTGTVTSAPAGINCGATCAAPFASGTQITLTAAPATGSTFTGWGAPCSGTGTCVVTIAAATSVSATFAPSTTNFTLTVTKAGTGTGTVTSAPAGINCGATCSASFASGTQITLTAAPATGSTFTGWGAPCSGTGTCVVTITATTTVTATFAPTTTNFTLTVTKAGTGTGTVTSAPAGINCGAACAAPFASGTQITLTAAPSTGSTFAGWTAGPCSGTGTCVVTLTAATTVTATFTQSANNFTLTITKGGTGTGTVASTPAGINCGAACSAPFASGTVITLTATPTTGSTFAGWGSGPCEGTGTCTLTITAATTVVANFTQTTNNFTLTITKSGTGTGTVTSSPAGINCGATCSAPFASGTQITLTATPATGSTFTGWTAGPCEGTAPCTLTIVAATSVSAAFTQTTNNFTLTVTEAGTGSGTVTSTPAGIACPSTCSASFASGQVVALTANASDGSTFAGWSGAGCTGTNACSVTITTATTVTATFNSGNSPVTITVAPGAPTNVSTTPGGTAVFGLLLTATPGTTGTVTLGCSSPSSDITCQAVPGSIALTGKGTNIAIVLNTYCTANVPGNAPLMPGGTTGGIGLLLASVALCGAMWKKKSQPRWAVSFGVLVLLAAGMSACGALPKSPGGQATPPGNYALIVTATAPNGATSSVNLALTVLP
ncbi:MAG TPA: choice-of-anchor D domain-containing protein [Candidatus Acidoferrales bacterium]